MDVRVRVPTQLRDLVGGAAVVEVSVGGGADGTATVATVLDGLATAAPGARTSDPRRAGADATARQPVRRLRQRPRPRRPGDADRRRRGAVDHPCRVGRLTGYVPWWSKPASVAELAVPRRGVDAERAVADATRSVAVGVAVVEVEQRTGDHDVVAGAEGGGVGAEVGPQVRDPFDGHGALIDRRVHDAPHRHPVLRRRGPGLTVVGDRRQDAHLTDPLGHDVEGQVTVGAQRLAVHVALGPHRQPLQLAAIPDAPASPSSHRASRGPVVGTARRSRRRRTAGSRSRRRTGRLPRLDRPVRSTPGRCRSCSLAHPTRNDPVTPKCSATPRPTRRLMISRRSRPTWRSATSWPSRCTACSPARAE